MEAIYDEIKKRIDRQTAQPIYKQLADAVFYCVETGIIKSGDRLPPIRGLASALNVNSVTVVNAYKVLENQRVVYSITGSGFYVAEASNVENETVAILPSFGKSTPIITPQTVNFAKSSVSPELFPVDEFKEMFDRVLTRDKGSAFGYEQSLGFPALRESLCEYLDGFGIKTTGEKIQIISGAQQGVDTVAKALLKPSDCVLTENPTYFGAVGAFMSRSARVIGVDMENDGIDLNKLEMLVKLHRPKLLYVMTYFQTPTCVCYSIEKKRALIELAAKYDFYIIEEDNQSDFIYSETQSVVPLKALDYKNRVIYIKSFSKLLMPGLKLGFAALPKPVLNMVTNAKYTTDIDTSGFLQRAFDLFIETGGLQRHIKRMRSVFKPRCQTLISNAQNKLTDYFSFEPPNGGLSVWLNAKENLKLSSTEICKIAADNGVAIMPGDVFTIHEKSMRGVRLSFADVDETGIKLGVDRLAEALSILSMQG